MEKCKACRRRLTNETSKLYGYGPECLKKAVAEGNAPLEALEAAKQERRERKKKPRIEPQPVRCNRTMDLFERSRHEAIRLLKAAVVEVESYGVKVFYRIENEQE